jgi:hypothetical protein
MTRFEYLKFLSDLYARSVALSIDWENGRRSSFDEGAPNPKFFKTKLEEQIAMVELEICSEPTNCNVTGHDYSLGVGA